MGCNFCNHDVEPINLHPWEVEVLDAMRLLVIQESPRRDLASESPLPVLAGIPSNESESFYKIRVLHRVVVPDGAQL